MNKNIIIIVGVLAVVAIGGFLYTSNTKTKSQNMNKEGDSMMEKASDMMKKDDAMDNSNSGNKNGGDGFNGLLSEAVKLGVPMKCTTKMEDGTEMVGYLKDRKYYAEINQDGQEVKIVWKDHCMWSWSDEGLEGMESMGMQGVKFCYEVDEDGEDFWDMDADDVNMDQSVGANPYTTNVSCRPANIQDSMFNPPSDINFMEF